MRKFLKDLFEEIVMFEFFLNFKHTVRLTFIGD